jgi:hypothetical protein
VWLRTDAADYLYYEERTSPFHQAHVVASLAARLLIGDVAAEGMSRQLVPDLQLQAGKPFHGVEVSNAIGRSESESFAFEILRRRGFFPSALQAHILLRRLQPLRRVLPASAVDVQAGAVRRLYHSVVAVRDRRTGHRTRCVRRLQAEKSFRLPNVDDTLDRSPSGSADAYPRS